jgi:tRNA(Ile)-lysidine synthase
MLDKVRALALEYDMLPAGARILCAVSGGTDSMCLLHLLHTLGEQEGFTVYAAHFNHRLRGEESERDAAFVADWCARTGIDCRVEEADVAGAAARQGRGVEETARELRYAFLRRTAQALACERIATAHSADDNLETLLLHLVRGAGLHGLAGIPPRRGEIVRPLLGVTRQEIEDYLAQNRIPHMEDSTNTDEAYTRNRLRRQVIPVLKQLNPRVVESGVLTMKYLRADDDYLNAQAARACLSARWAGEDLVIEAADIAQLPAAIAPRAVRHLLEQMGDGQVNCSAAHLNGVVDLARSEDPSAVFFLPDGRMAQRVYRQLLFTTRGDPLPPLSAVPLVLDGETAAGDTGWRVRCRPVICPAQGRDGVFYLRRDGVEGELVLRARQTGDEILLPGRGGTKTLKKLLIDEKVPRRERERIPVLADEAGVIAVAGFGPDSRRLARPGEAAYELGFYRKE